MNVCKLLGIFASVAISAVAMSASAQTHRPVPLTNACIEQLKEQMLQKESAYLSTQYGATIREPEVYGWGNLKADGTYSFRGTVNDLSDGRSVDYAATQISQKDADSCKIELKRDDQYACRYSSDGDDEFQERSGARFVREVTLKPTTKLSKIETAQIAAFLNAEEGVAKAIASTDDGEITKRVVKFKNGVRADYYKAYGGDNPFGIFYREKTMEVIGDNSDASICISYAIEK